MDQHQIKTSALLLTMTLLTPQTINAAPQFGDWNVESDADDACRIRVISPVEPVSGFLQIQIKDEDSPSYSVSIFMSNPPPNSGWNVDTTPPQITPPNNLNLSLPGPIGFVDLDPQHGGSAPTVTDNETVSFDFSMLENVVIGPLASGRHQLTWFAQDEMGNESEAVQQIDILPTANFSLDQIIGEGGTVEVTVYLSGPPPSYPVTIPFSLSGTASAAREDRDYFYTPAIHTKEIVITEGTSASLTVETATNQLDEADETLIFTMGSPQHAVPGSQRSHTITITDRNLAPRLSLSARQNGNQDGRVAIGHGIITLTARATDPNPQDTLRYEWPLAPDCSESQLEIESDSLPLGPLQVEVSALDSGQPSQRTTTQLWLNISETPPASNPADSDNDGIPDEFDTFEQPFQIAGYGAPGLAPDEGRKIVNEQAVAPASIGWSIDSIAADLNYTMLITTQPGLKLRTGPLHGLDTGTTENATLAWDKVANHLPQMQMSSPFFTSVKLTGLSQTGQSASLVIPQAGGNTSEALQLLVYTTTHGLQAFVEDSANHLASARRVGGFCPPVGSDQYETGLTAAQACIQITIEDGGPNDADRFRDGAISLNGGLVSETQIQTFIATANTEILLATGGQAQLPQQSVSQTSASATDSNDDEQEKNASGAGAISLFWFAIAALALRFRHNASTHRAASKGA